MIPPTIAPVFGPELSTAAPSGGVLVPLLIGPEAGTGTVVGEIGMMAGPKG